MMIVEYLPTSADISEASLEDAIIQLDQLVKNRYEKYVLYDKMILTLCSEDIEDIIPLIGKYNSWRVSNHIEISETGENGIWSISTRVGDDIFKVSSEKVISEEV